MIVPVADVSKHSPPPRGVSVFDVYCHGNGFSHPTSNKMSGVEGVFLTTEPLVTGPDHVVIPTSFSGSKKSQ